MLTTLSTSWVWIDGPTGKKNNSIYKIKGPQGCKRNQAEGFEITIGKTSFRYYSSKVVKLELTAKKVRQVTMDVFILKEPFFIYQKLGSSALTDSWSKLKKKDKEIPRHALMTRSEIDTYFFRSSLISSTNKSV